MLSHTLRPNFCYLKIIHIFHPCYDPKIIGQVTSVQNRQKNKCACIHEIIQYHNENSDENERQIT